MVRSTIGKAIRDLRSEIVLRLQDPAAIALLAGTACNFAFVGQVFFSPAMRHTSTLMLSYTDTSFVFGMIVSIALLAFARRNDRVGLHVRSLWIASLSVQLSIVVYFALPEAGLAASPIMDWVCGAVFGAYVALATFSWLRVHACCRVSVAVWNIMMSAVIGSFLMWVFTGLARVQLLACMIVLALVSTALLSGRLRAMLGDVSPRDEDRERAPFQYPYAAVFLFSFAFEVAVSLAELGGDGASFVTGAFFAPFLFVCALVLSLKNFSAFALLNIAVPAIATATIAASFLGVDPVISFDLASVGLFLFLAYAVILLCAGMRGNDRLASCAFLRLLIAFSGGCIVGRVCAAMRELLADAVPAEALVLLAILAAIGAMILCIRRGVVPKQLGELFHYEEGAFGSNGLSAAQCLEVERAANGRNLGSREKEVLILLLKKKSASEIAAELVIANGTSKSHIRHLYKKLDVHSREELFDLFGIE